MKEVFDALERLAMPDELHAKECEKLGISLTEDYEIIKQVLTKIKSINEAKPSEVMKCLEHIGNYVIQVQNGNRTQTRCIKDICKIEFEEIKQALLKAQELEKENAEYKKVLSIIKEKPQAELSLIQLGEIKTYEEYLDRTQHWEGIYWDMIYTEEEFCLLKNKALIK